ncbi:hypothetical protein K1719_000914 [Acacia pycnantha]|nr:hypothetical protein K1719_000914 [Acacia pycnantha]
MNSGNELLETVSPKSSVSDKDSEKSNGFVTIDLEALPCAINNKDTNPNSVTALQRKGWSDKEVNSPAAAFDDWIVIPISTSPRACCVPSTPEKVEAPVVGSGNSGGGPGVHHQITVTVNTMGNEDNSMARRNSSFNFKRPSNNWSLPCKVLGSCNGLICICNVAEDIALWNTSTRRDKIIALLLVERRPESDSNLFAARGYGFGYDSFSDDFKLLRISCFVDLHTRSFESQVKVYSLRTNSWKSIQRMPYALCARTMGVFVGGALHWVVTRKLELDSPDLIIAFDLKHENLREVPMPGEEEVGRKKKGLK